MLRIAPCSLYNITHSNRLRLMADQIFENPRLVAIYDYFDGSRADLLAYIHLSQELNAIKVVDVGCGTGSFACLIRISHKMSLQGH